jgi:HK97 family phage prohead protease
MTMTEPSAAERSALEATRGASDVLASRDFVVSDLEVRAPQGDSPYAEFYGHASVTGKSYEMYGGPDKGGWNETVDKGAFKRTLAATPDVPFKINHEGMTLARTVAGNLHLREDATGLEVKASLDTRVTAVNDLVLLMEGGNIDEMSFAFRIRKQQWLNADGEEVPWWDMAGIDRHLQELDIHKGDVSVVNYGASPHTAGASIMRSLSDLRSLPLEDCDETELREAIAYLETLLPAPSIHPDLVAAQHRALLRHVEYRALLL